MVFTLGATYKDASQTPSSEAFKDMPETAKLPTTNKENVSFYIHYQTYLILIMVLQPWLKSNILICLFITGG